MKNSKAILVHPGLMEIREANMPVLKDTDVMIRVKEVGVCGSDVHGFQFGPFIPPKDPNQEIGLGHECAGVVVKVGAKVKRFKEGDRVCIEPGVPCGHCKYCRTGRYNLCPDVDFMATQPNYRGALTNYLVHPEEFTFHLPDNMDFVEGALLEPASVGMHAALLSGIRPGESAVILGGGCIGLMTLQGLVSCGVTDITVVDVMENRLELAKKLGAAHTVNGAKEDTVAVCRAFTDDMGADYVFETAGAVVTAKQAVQIVARGGKIMQVGTQSKEVPVDFLKINREVTIQTSFRYRNCYPAVIAAISSGRFDVKSMVTASYDYKDVQQAFEDSVNKKAEIIKSVIHMPEE